MSVKLSWMLFTIGNFQKLKKGHELKKTVNLRILGYYLNVIITLQRTTSSR